MTNVMVDGSFQKTVVEHFCYNDTSLDGCVKGSQLFSDELSRHRVRLHFGSKEEILFRLQTFGIPTQDFPLLENDDLDYTWHHEWIQMQRKREEDLGSQLVIIPRKHDVLFGRGRDTRVHTGNMRAKHLVDERFEEYEAAGKTRKTAIAGEVVAAIQKSHGRFLKWEGEGQGWSEVEWTVARAKVAHFFRRRRIPQLEGTGSQKRNNASS